MLETLDLRSSFLFSQSSLLLRRIAQTPNFASSLRRSKTIQLGNPIVSARRGRRRTGKSRSQGTARLLLNLASLASSLKLLPRPLDLIVEDIAAGYGGSGGGDTRFWDGFGWGDFGRRRGRRKSNLWLFGLAAVCGLGFVFAGDLRGNAVWWGLGFAPLGIGVCRMWERDGGIQGWVFLGFCLWSFVMGMSFGEDELRRLISRIRVSLPALGTGKGRGRRRSGRRVF